MTGQFEGIGAQLKQEGDYIGIERIIAGSACWRQGDLEVGDRIIAVAQGSEEPVDIIGYKYVNPSNSFAEKGSEVRLTVRKGRLSPNCPHHSRCCRDQHLCS